MLTSEEKILDALERKQKAENEVRRDQWRNSHRLMSNHQQPGWPAYERACLEFDEAVNAWAKERGLLFTDMELKAQVEDERR